MRAAVHRRYGPPEVVAVTEVPRPTPEPDELLVRVHRTTVNRTDCGFRAASPFVARFFTGLLRPKITIMGNEFAGVVEEVGPQVTGFAVGDRVLGYVEGRFGAHAEYLTVAEDASIAPIPDGIGFDEAAASTEGAHYALAFIQVAGIEPGQDVLVNGGTGAIGSAAVQLLAAMDVHVTAVCGTDHLDLVRDLGAERVIDYQSSDFTTEDATYDAVLDTVGKSTFGRCKHLLAPRGVYLSSELGPWVQNPLLALVTPLGRGRRVRFPMPKDDQEMIGDLARRVGDGSFRPLIDRHYPLDEIVDAYRYVESGQKIGNVVIDVTEPTG